MSSLRLVYTPNIEQQFIKWAKQVNRYDLDNEDDGREEHLGQENQAHLPYFLAGVQPVLRLAGIDVFEPNLDGSFSYTVLIGRSTSHLKIASSWPAPAVRILAGSQMERLDEAKVIEAKLPGVIYDTAKRIHIFTMSVEVTLTNLDIFPKLLECSLSQWKSKAGISSLHTTLELLRPAS